MRRSSPLCPSVPVPLLVVSFGILSMLVLGACSDTTGPSGERPSLVSVTPVVPDSVGPEVMVTIRGQGTWARVRYASADGTSAETPAVPFSGGIARVMMLALHPATDYGIVALAGTATDSVASRSIAVTTDTLPTALQNAAIITQRGTRRGGELILTEVVSTEALYATLFDSSGGVAWYRAFGGHFTISDLHQQPNGDFTVYLGTSTGWQPVDGHFAEFGLDGAIVATYAAPSGVYTDPHELQLLPDGSGAYLTGYTIEPGDMSAHGGTTDTPVAGHQIYFVTPSGSARMIFDARQYFTPADWIAPPLTGIGDFDHPNAFDIDRDGMLVVSWRNFESVTKIDPANGRVVWVMGGRHATMTITDDPLGGFSGQHYVRVLPGGIVSVYDNGTAHTPPETRAVDYAVDTTAGIATMVREFRRPNHDVFTPFVGSQQLLPNGDRLIGYGAADLISEFTPDGTILWNAKLRVGGSYPQFYRALMIPAFR